MLFRPVYLRAPPLRYEPPVTVIEIPVKKEPTPPPKAPTPLPVPPEEPEVPPEPEPKPKPKPVVEEKKHIPLLVCGHGVTAVYPESATDDVLAGNVDYFLVDDTGVTMFNKKFNSTALKLEKEAQENVEECPCVGTHQRILKREGRSLYFPDSPRRSDGTDFLRSSPRSRAMSSGSLYRGYTGPRA